MNNRNSDEEITALWREQELQPVVFRIEELRRAAGRFSRRIFWRNAREYAAAVVVVVWIGYDFAKIHSVLARVGCGLIVAAAAFVSWRLHRSRTAGDAEAMDATSCLDFYRGELLRQRDLLRDVWKWYLSPLIPGLAAFLAGTLQAALAEPGARAHLGAILARYGATTAWCAAVFILIGWLNARAARKLQRRIDELDAAKIEP